MPFFTYDSVVTIIGLILQATLCSVLMRRGLARLYPVFLTYLLINIVTDPMSMLFNQYGNFYRQFYFTGTLLDYVLQMLIVFEIGRNVLRPARNALKLPWKPFIAITALLSLIIALSLFVPAKSIGSPDMIQLSLKVSLGLAILKLLVFILLVGFAQVLGINWKNHVLQFATGLAFFACVQLFVQIATSHVPRGANHYLSHLDTLMRIPALAFDMTLVFWIWAFSRNEAPRKDFTPQMQEILVTIALTARRTRIAVTRSTDRR